MDAKPRGSKLCRPLALQHHLAHHGGVERHSKVITDAGYSKDRSHANHGRHLDHLCPPPLDEPSIRRVGGSDCFWREGGLPSDILLPSR
jgi:hypothetical protein